MTKKNTFVSQLLIARIVIIAPVHGNDAVLGKLEDPANSHVMRLAIGDGDELGQVTGVIQTDMEFDCYPW